MTFCQLLQSGLATFDLCRSDSADGPQRQVALSKGLDEQRFQLFNRYTPPTPPANHEAPGSVYDGDFVRQ